MVAAGKVEFGIVSADELVIARSNGADVVALFAAYQTNPQGIMTHAEKGFKEIGDVFKTDGTLAMQKGLPYSNFLEKKFGFDKVKIVPSPNGDLSVFRTDSNYSMQCFVTSEPIAAKHAGLNVKTFLIAGAGYNPYTTVLVTRGDYLKAHSGTVKAVVEAVREGWASYLKDPTATNSAMQKLNPTMDAETFKDSADAQKPLIETDETNKLGVGAMTTERWQTLIDQLADLKVIEKKPAPSDCFTEIK
jgi:NitT/TauT family transport system substrate-binding protein